MRLSDLDEYTRSRVEKRLGMAGIGSESFPAKDAIEKAMREAMSDTWMVQGYLLSRDQTMQLVVELVGDGCPLARVSRLPGMPDTRTILRWRHSHPLFDTEMRLAEEAAAYHLVAEAGEILDAADKDSAYQDDNRAKHRRWLAAKMNGRFVEKTKIEDETPLARRSDQELLDMLALQLSASPDILKQANLKVITLESEDATPEHE